MRSSRGFTIIELMITLVIVAVLLAVVVPSFTDLMARRRLEGAATELSTDLQYARTEAISRQRDVALVTAAGGGSYTITAAGPVPLKTVALPTGVTVTQNVTLTFTALRGVPNETAGGNVTIDVASSQTGGQMRLITNFMGRVELCSPSGSVKGHRPC